MAMRKRRGGVPQVEPPQGKIRQSQMVTTYGAGGMVDLLEHSALIGGLDFWRYAAGQVGASYIHEPRLRSQVAARFKRAYNVELDKMAPFRAPPQGDDRDPGRFSGVQCAQFPDWFVCQACRALQPGKNLEVKRARLWHQCSATGPRGECTPVRFVSACKNGHLEEFPWVSFVHEGPRCPAPELYLREGATGDFSQILVECVCGKKRQLGTALAPNVLPRCKGRRPWLGDDGDDASCDKGLELLVRTASNAYFSQVTSALSIPDGSEKLRKAVETPDVWRILQAATPETLPAFRSIPDVKSVTEGYSDTEVMAAIRAVGSNNDDPGPPLRTAEWKHFLAQPLEVGGELPPEGEDFWARRLRERDDLPTAIGPIVLAKKLREVRVQVGFTRFKAANANLQGLYDDQQTISPLGLNTNWLPASEIRGEGVLLCLDDKALARWEARDAVQRRQQRLIEGYQREYGDVAGFPGIRFFLLHSLSHLLINSIAMHSGYAASSIRERIYADPDDETNMAGILLHTGTSGSEGTLGGLVEQGRKMGFHLRRAFEFASLCSNDPVCARHEPIDHAERHLEGAACHGCLYVAECSCERFNRYLDRALVVPCMGHERQLAFFSERP